MSPVSDKKIESLLERVEKPARYIGGEVGSIRKDEYSSRLVLSYPDVYEIGTANQAVQLLYSLVNSRSGVWAERAYCPWPDMAALMRQEGIPLFSLESWEPVRSADIWGITLQHELNYTNILEMLDLAGVPLHWEERGDDEPLVFAGGPCAGNPHPVAAFFDFIIIGDGEEVIIEVLEICEQTRALPRRERLQRLSEVAGVFVPAFPRRVTRVAVHQLTYENIPVRPIIPSMHAVHDRATIEVKRGCTRGCRFCMAGIWYRPVRERSVADICQGVSEIIAKTGYQEASLSSLSATDHSGIEPILRELAASQPTLTVSLPSLRVDPDSIRLLKISRSRRGSITLAPEAGSQRLRDVINKQVTAADIEQALHEAFDGGCTTVKLYFMIGLPGETEADLSGIIDVAVDARRIGRQVAQNAGRVQVNVSIASFIPKPHTPFQWGGMNTREELEAKHAFLRSNMPRKQIKLSMHDIEPSLVEGAIARGGDGVAGVIESAWRAGARFDAWTEHFKPEAWEQALAATGSTVEREASRDFADGDALPWDDIDSRVTKDFLLAEKEKAERAELTPDCCWDECSDCGVCDGDLQMRIESEAAAASEPAPGDERAATGSAALPSQTEAAPE
ncbi:MAG: TIGR03960 family B12-binding radical SAM protein [Thermoleophilia bacterium]